MLNNTKYASCCTQDSSTATRIENDRKKNGQNTDPRSTQQPLHPRSSTRALHGGIAKGVTRMLLNVQIYSATSRITKKRRYNPGCRRNATRYEEAPLFAFRAVLSNPRNIAAKSHDLQRRPSPAKPDEPRRTGITRGGLISTRTKSAEALVACLLLLSTSALFLCGTLKSGSWGQLVCGDSPACATGHALHVAGAAFGAREAGTRAC